MCRIPDSKTFRGAAFDGSSGAASGTGAIADAISAARRRGARRASAQDMWTSDIGAVLAEHVLESIFGRLETGPDGA